MRNLRSYIQELHSGSASTVTGFLLLIYLWPVSLVYRGVVFLVDLMYSTGLRRARKLQCPVISVGNLTTGGTGKTPMTKLIAEHLQKSQTVAILSRGYRSSSENRPQIFRGDQLSSTSASTVGDEAAELAQNLPTVWFGIGADRYSTGSKLTRDHDVQVVVLDDGFQHRKLARDCDIVLIDAMNPFGNGHLLPAGPQREPLSALRRADIAILTRTESVDESTILSIETALKQYLDASRLFRVRTSIKSIVSLATGIKFAYGDKSALLFSGVGNPASFESLVKSSGIQVVGHSVYPDHYAYSEADLQVLREILKSGKAGYLLTTAKDAAKIEKSAFRADECAIVEIGIDFVDRAHIFWGIIARCVSA